MDFYEIKVSLHEFQTKTMVCCCLLLLNRRVLKIFNSNNGRRTLKARPHLDNLRTKEFSAPRKEQQTGAAGNLDKGAQGSCQAVRETGSVHMVRVLDA